MKLALCVLILHIKYHHQQWIKLEGDDLLSAQKLLNITTDMIKDTDRRTALLLTEQKLASGCAAFEVGYLTYNIEEKYRRMVDKYNTSQYMRKRLYLMELVLYLEEIEHHYWEINHLSNMLHEVERKYKIESQPDEEYVDVNRPVTHGHTFPSGYFDVTHGKKKRGKGFKVFKYIMGRFTSVKPKRSTFWPLEYGWEADYDWWTNESKYQPRWYNDTCGIYATLPSKERNIINELSWGTKIRVLKDYKNEMEPSRRVGVSLLRMPEEKIADEEVTTSDTTVTQSEDNSMKMKLFRLMYETVRDSDLKVRRAELIKAHYTNYSIFEIGFLMGDITDKLNIMTDISLTLKRLYAEWRPMEHINAYEQIANKAIEISHLIDMIRIIHKKTPTTTTSKRRH